MSQLTNIYTYDTSNLIIQKPTEETINTTTPPIKYLRANIKTKYPDGSIGDLIVPTEVLFSFGVSPSHGAGQSIDEKGPVTGYTLPMCCFSKDGPKDIELKWVDAFENIVDVCKDFVVKHKKLFKRPHLEKRDLRKFNASSFFWKEDEDGNRLPRGPTLYPKLLHSKKNGDIEIKTNIYRMGSNTLLDPLSLIGKFGNAKGAIKIESIYSSGERTSLQVKLWEVDFDLKDSGRERLLPMNIVSVGESKDDENFDESETYAPAEGSIADSSSEEDSEESDAPTPVRAKAAPVTRRKKAVAKK